MYLSVFGRIRVSKTKWCWTVLDHSQMLYLHTTGSENKGKHKWGEAEVDAVERHMMHFIQGHRIPQKNDCVECLEAEPEALSARTWKGVKDYVRNRITALERQSGTSVSRSGQRSRRWWVKQCVDVWIRVVEITRIQVQNWVCHMAETVFSWRFKGLHIFIIIVFLSKKSVLFLFTDLRNCRVTFDPCFRISVCG